MVEYEELLKGYKLPTFDDLDKEFDVGILEETSFPLREIRKKMTEKVEILGEVFGQILQPNPESIVDMHECKFFEDADRSEIFKIYSEMQQIIRTSTLCGLHAEEAEDAEWIKTTAAAWKDIKKRSSPYIQKMSETWNEIASDTSERLRYLG